MRIAVFLAVFYVSLLGQTRYQKAPQDVRSILDAPALPVLAVSPAKTHVLLAEPLRYPPISEVGAPFLRLAGIRINPATNDRHLATTYVKLTLKSLSDGREIALALPPGWKPGTPKWNKDGTLFAFTAATAGHTGLWIGMAASGKLTHAEGVRINGVAGAGFEWAEDGKTMLIETVPDTRGAPPTDAKLPAGPHVQQSLGRSGPVPTYEDMLQNSHDEDLFEYYATAQLAWYDTQSGRASNVGSPGIFAGAHPSPDGKHLLIVRIHKPYSYFHTYQEFARDAEVWDRAGKLERSIASLPVADRVALGGVPTGPRNYRWEPASPAALLWVEALDGGNPKEKAIHRDRVVMLNAPFAGEPSEVIKTPQRFSGMLLGEKSHVALISDYDRDKRWSRTFELDLSQPGATPKEIWGRNVQDRYKDPGTPVTRGAAGGRGGPQLFGFASASGGMKQNGDLIFLRGQGASPKGDRPFLDTYSLKTGERHRLFQCDDESYEMVEAILDDGGKRLITLRESPADPPNYFLLDNGKRTALTDVKDPAPQLRQVEKRLITYKRDDGVPLSFHLYLPPGYKPGTRLPTVVWAYPLEYNDADTAGQISGSTKRFTTITGMSHLFFLLAGYAILDGAAMPVIGDPETVNNTYLEQIIADAKAAIDKGVELGVTDRARVGVGGHSYGAFMTANLLAHSDLFKAGIARSGAYNRTLTPFGFQTERRTFWEAEDTYLRMSPFMSANKIRAPILLIHGEADNNTGTFPIQSERMFAAIRGNGGTVRLVMLPAESHGYQARESIEHTLWEMFAWFDRYVKGGDSGGRATERTARGALAKK